MFKSTATRLYLVAALVPVTYGIAHLVQVSLDPPEVELPKWSFEQMPIELGPWKGKTAELDPEVAMAGGAVRVVNRIYQDEQSRVISFYGAMFTNPAEGVLHSPMNCYRQTGWQLKSETRETVQVNDQLAIPVSLSKWERKGENVIVVYWYQLGEHVLFDRLDLGLNVRWSLRNREKWPPIVKVMLHVPAPDIEDAKTAVLAFTKLVAAWENQPKHRQEMGIPAL